MAVPATPSAPPVARASRRAFDRAAAIVFCALIAAPTIDQLARPASARDARLEKRTPEPRPSAPATFAELTRWPERCERWHRDVFGLRDRLLGARNAALLAGGIAPNAVLDVGRDGWIFYRDDGALDAHRGVLTRCGSEIDAWIRALDERQRRLARHGARFLFALAPDKESIYPELCPPEWEAIGPTLTEVFLAELARRTQVEVVDLRPALISAKRFDRPDVEDYVYVPRGTHWSSRGALAATNAILDALRDRWPAVGSLDTADFQYMPIAPSDEDSWAGLLYAPWLLRTSWDLWPEHGWDVPLPAEFLDPRHPTIDSQPDGSLPSVHLLHDSFATSLFPYLAQRCRRVRAEWRTFLNEAIVVRERPDVVLAIRSERLLSIPPDLDLHVEPAEPAPALDAATLRWSLGEGPAPRVLGAGRLEVDGAWTSAAWSDRFEIETAGLAPGERACVRLDVEAPEDGEVELASNDPGGSKFPKERRTSAGLLRGANRRAIELPGAGHGGRLVVRFGPPGTWRIRALELHVVPAGAAGR